MWLARVLEFLNRNSGALSVVFSAVVTGATVAYVRLTRRMAIETTRLRKASSEPLIAVHLEPSQRALTVLELVIENAGAGAAYDVKFVLADDWIIHEQSGRKLGDMKIIRDGVRYLAPKQTLRFMAGFGPHLAQVEQQSFQLSVSYRSLAGEPYTEVFEVSAEHFLDMTQIGRPAQTRIAEALEKIASTVQRLEQSAKLQVELWTQADIRQRDEELRAHYDRLHFEAQERDAAATDRKALAPGQTDIPNPSPAPEPIEAPQSGTPPNEP